jgi:peptidoglycan hydrolase-like protein with peptidoglycan-binding domain
MIALGAYDSDVQDRALDEYVQYTLKLTGVQEWSGKRRLRGDKEGEWVSFQKADAGDMKVKEVQQFLKDASFFAGKVDGICGYRTTAAIRLFQEYVRTVEGDASIGFPDGKLGPTSFNHVKRWKTSNKKADWTNFSSAKPSTEYTKWMNLLNRVKQKYSATPNKML